jgi:hypothetical protein
VELHSSVAGPHPEEVDTRTHAIIHLEHAIEKQDLDLEERAVMIITLEQQLQVLQLQASPAPAAPTELDAMLMRSRLWDVLGCRVDRPFVILNGWVRLSSSSIACNLGYNPWHENKVLVTRLFMIGEFYFGHLW